MKWENQFSLFVCFHSGVLASIILNCSKVRGFLSWDLSWNPSLCLPIYCTSRLLVFLFWRLACSLACFLSLFILRCFFFVIRRVWSWLARLSPAPVPFVLIGLSGFYHSAFFFSQRPWQSCHLRGCFRASQRDLWTWKCRQPVRWIDRPTEKKPCTETGRPSVVVVCWKHVESRPSTCLPLLVKSD